MIARECGEPREPRRWRRAGLSCRSRWALQCRRTPGRCQRHAWLSVFHDYATYAAHQLPYIFTPNNYRIYAVNSKLQGVNFNPLYTFLPECWYWTK